MGKILLIHKGGAGGIRGTEACLIGAIEALRQEGHQILFARNLPIIDHLIKDHVEKIVPIEIPELLVNGLRSQLPLIAYFKLLLLLAREMREFKPDLILASGGLPCQSAVPLGWLFRTHVLCHYHHPATKRYYYNWLVPFVNSLIFPSDFSRLDVFEKTKRSGQVIYNGVDTEVFAPVERDWHLRDKLNIPRDAIVIGQVGQLASNKRPELLIRAFDKAVKAAPHLHLCIVGKGPLENSIRAQIAALSLEQKITVTGYVEDVTPFYQHVFDVNALVSSDEGLGISILEGAACGLPSLISDCTGLSETTINNITGLAFPPDEESALVNAMISFARDSDFRERAGKAARALAVEKFSKDQYMASIASTVSALLT